MRLLGIFLTSLVLFVAGVYAQTETARPEKPVDSKIISGGVLNGKATSLPIPAYPAAARAVNAEGTIIVEVVIDEEGSVNTATAVSGHPLLRAASVDAARGAKFTPTLLMGEPVKVTGVITYNFVRSVTSSLLGFEIAFCERSLKPSALLKSLAKDLPEAWKDERKALETLSFDESSETASRVITGGVSSSPSEGRGSGQDAPIIRIYPPYFFGKLTPSSVEALRNVRASILSKLVSNQKAEWHFRLGVALGILAAEIDEASKLSHNLAELEQIVGNVPFRGSESTLMDLRTFVDLCRVSDGSPEAKEKILRLAQKLKNSRI